MFLTFDNVHNVIVQAVPNFNVCLKAFSQVTTGPSLRDLNSRLDDVAFQMRTFRFKIYNYRQHWQWQPIKSHPFVATPQKWPNRTLQAQLCRGRFRSRALVGRLLDRRVENRWHWVGLQQALHSMSVDQGEQEQDVCEIYDQCDLKVDPETGEQYKDGQPLTLLRSFRQHDK